MKDFEQNGIAYVDTENLVWSNWARFMNDGQAKKNIQCSMFNYQTYIFAITNIDKGEELIYEYGQKYWEFFGSAKKY